MGNLAEDMGMCVVRVLVMGMRMVGRGREQRVRG